MPEIWIYCEDCENQRMKVRKAYPMKTENKYLVCLECPACGKRETIRGLKE